MNRKWVLVAAWLGSMACGPSSTSPSQPSGGLLPPVSAPPLACTDTGKSCACVAGEATGKATGRACDPSVVAGDAGECCASLDFPFAGSCRCSAAPSCDGGAYVASCSSPPLMPDAGAGSPANCGGSSCAGGVCCTSRCQNGACQSTCS